MTRGKILVLLVAVAATAFVTTVATFVVLQRLSLFSVSGPSLPPGYKAWHGLAVPEYFELKSEQEAPHPYLPGNSPPVCKQAIFNHGLHDLGTVPREAQYEWQKKGLQLRIQRGRAYTFTSQEGRLVYAFWHGTNSPIVDLYTVVIVDCPPGAGPNP